MDDPTDDDAEELRDRVTRILEDEAGEASEATRDADRLLPAVYDELRRLAASYLGRERPGHTLQPTALVHEAYLRLVHHDRVSYEGRSHFFAVGARMMRRLLVDHARRKGSRKRGGDALRVTLDAELVRSVIGGALDAASFLALDDALHRLADLDERAARVVELRFFGGLTMKEVADHLGVSKRTAEGDWTHARAWLRRELA